MLYPMPLRDGAVVDQAGWDHRLTRDGALWTLSKRAEDGWEVLHAFDDTPQRLIDYEVAHHYTSTHSRSPFTAGWSSCGSTTASAVASSVTSSPWSTPTVASSAPL